MRLPGLSLFAAALCSACVAGSAGIVPLPVRVAPQELYVSAHCTAHAVADGLRVRGDFFLAHNYPLAQIFIVRVRALSADGRILAESTTTLSRLDARYRGDPRREAVFSATLPVHPAAVDHLEIGLEPADS